MHALAKHLEAQGRGNDSMLVHMTPREVGGLQALARASGGSLTTNPATGFPEAGWLDSILPTLAGVAGGALGVDPYIAGLGGAAVQTAITGDLGKGLMAGLGAYGGASIGYGMLGGSGRDTLGLNSAFGKDGKPITLADTSKASASSSTTWAPDATGTMHPVTQDAALGATSTPANKGMFDNFSAASRAGMGDSFAKYAPFAAALGVASPLLGSMGPKTASYNPTPSTTDPVYKGPYTFAPRQVISKPNQLTNSSEHMYFQNPNDYQVIPHAAAGGLVALADGGVTTIAAPELYGDPSRGKLYGGGKPRTGADYVAMLGALPSATPPAAPYKDYTFHPQASGAGEKNYGIVTPKGVDLSGPTYSGDFSGGAGAPPGGQIYGPTNDGTFAGIDGNPGSTGDRYGDISGNINFGTLGIGGSNFGNTGYGDFNTGTSGLGSLAGQMGDYASNFAKLPTSWTDANTRQALINAAGFIPGAGMIPSIGAGLAEGFHLVDPAGGTGSGAGNIAGQSGMVQDLTRKGADWAYHNIFGGDYSNAEQVAPLNDAFNQSAAGVNDIYNTANNSPSAVLSNYYGPEDAALGIDSKQNSDFINGRGMFAPGSSYWESVAQQFSNLGGSEGSGRSAGDSGVGGIGGSGAWNGSGGGGGWGGFGDSATRLGGGMGGGGMDFLGFLPVSPQGSARGGPVHLGNNSFVVDARTVSEMGNGSSSAGQELLARLGGQPIHGPGDGVSDSIHANIGGKQEARVARDEVQFSPEAVARLGGGDASKGSKFLYSLMAKAREARIKAAKKDGGRGVDTGLRALVGAK